MLLCLRCLSTILADSSQKSKNRTLVVNTCQWLMSHITLHFFLQRKNSRQRHPGSRPYFHGSTRESPRASDQNQDTHRIFTTSERLLCTACSHCCISHPRKNTNFFSTPKIMNCDSFIVFLWTMSWYFIAVCDTHFVLNKAFNIFSYIFVLSCLYNVAVF